jgi:hypothetical protein
MAHLAPAIGPSPYILRSSLSGSHHGTGMAGSADRGLTAGDLKIGRGYHGRYWEGLLGALTSKRTLASTIAHFDSGLATTQFHKD